MDTSELIKDLNLSQKDRQAFLNFCAVRIVEIDKKLRFGEKQLVQMKMMQHMSQVIDTGLAQVAEKYDWKPDRKEPGAEQVAALMAAKRKTLSGLRKKVNKERQINPGYLILKKHQRMEALRAEKQWLEQQVTRIMH